MAQFPQLQTPQRSSGIQKKSSTRRSDAERKQKVYALRNYGLEGSSICPIVIDPDFCIKIEEEEGVNIEQDDSAVESPINIDTKAPRSAECIPALKEPGSYEGLSIAPHERWKKLLKSGKLKTRKTTTATSLHRRRGGVNAFHQPRENTPPQANGTRKTTSSETAFLRLHHVRTPCHYPLYGSNISPRLSNCPHDWTPRRSAELSNKVTSGTWVENLTLAMAKLGTPCSV